MNVRDDPWPSALLVEAALWTAITLGLGAILTLAKVVLVPLAMATLLSFALSPAVRALQKIGAPRPLGVVAALAIFVAAIGLWVWFVNGQVLGSRRETAGLWPKHPRQASRADAKVRRRRDLRPPDDDRGRGARS